jgi:hypothetical protein
VSQIPLTIGITGHRDLLPEDIPEVEQRLGAVFDELQREYPNTPLRVLSSLAEGADRMAARLAIDRKIELVVPLPMARAEYEKDFPASKGAFSALIDKAAATFELPLAPGNTATGISTPGLEREIQYEQAGALVVRHCHILVAVWDATDSELTGGTSEIVKFMLDGLPERYAPTSGLLDAPDVGPVFHIPVRRRTAQPDGRTYADFCTQLGHAGTFENGLYRLLLPSRGRSVQNPPVWRPKPRLTLWQYLTQSAAPVLEQRFGDEAEVANLERIEAGYGERLRKLDQFNRDAERLPSPSALAESRQQILPQGSSISADEAAIAATYCTADVVAMRLQRIHLRLARMIYGCAVGMAITYALFGTLLTCWWLVTVYLTFFLLMATAWVVHRRHTYHDRFLDCRALAEGLRVQLFWFIGGVNKDVAHSYLRKQSEALEWIRSGLRAVAIRAANPAALATLDTVRQQLISEHWIQDQLVFFKHRTQRETTRLRLINVAAMILYTAGLAFAALELPATYRGKEHELVESIMLLMGLPPAIAVIWQSYGEHMSFKDHAMEYERMRGIFARAEARSLGMKPAQFRELMQDLGREALMENGDWLIVHRRRPVAMQ